MRGASANSLAAAQNGFEPVLRAAGPAGEQLASQLFTVTAALDGSATLRRSLTDPSRTGNDKANVVTRLLAGFDTRAIDLVVALVRSRWSRDEDLVEATERVAIDAALASAQARGSLERVEDEFFRITRALAGQREARQILSDERVSPQRRQGFLQSILGTKVDPVTRLLAGHATMAPRGRRFVAMLGWYGDIAADRRKRLVAQVTAAAPLGDAQLQRLVGLLERAYGRGVQVNVTVDPDVIGGLRIQVGADVVDSTLFARITDARRRLVS